jgi:hypothetical protein
VDLINLALARDQWRALVDTGMSFLVVPNSGNIMSDCAVMLISEEGLSGVSLVEAMSGVVCNIAKNFGGKYVSFLF